MAYNDCEIKSCNHNHDNYFYRLCVVEIGEEMPVDCKKGCKGINFNRPDFRGGGMNEKIK